MSDAIGLYSLEGVASEVGVNYNYLRQLAAKEEGSWEFKGFRMFEVPAPRGRLWLGYKIEPRMRRVPVFIK